MRLPGRSSYIAVLAALAVSTGVAAADDPAPPANGGDVAAQCYAQAGGSTEGFRFCRSVQALEWMGAAGCRTPLRSGAPEWGRDPCSLADGRKIGGSHVTDYEQSWVHRALSLQRDLDADVPFPEQLLAHTHNSFNASAYAVPHDGSPPAYYPTLTNQDPNQVYSITDQLRLDIRAIEIDLHWVPSEYGRPKTGGFWVTMCHGTTQSAGPADAHVGCTIDRPVQSGLAEVGSWLRAHPHEVVLLYLENQMDDNQLAHDIAANLIESRLGNLVFRPSTNLPAGACADMPVEETRADLLAQGKQILLVGNCGPGAWSHWVFTRGPQWDESGDPTDYDATDCARDQALHSAGMFRRYFESSPWLEAMTGASTVISPAATAAMVRCGANIIGFDQLRPEDGRLAALVWSWADDEPLEGGSAQCARLGDDGRFHAAGCNTDARAACVDGQGNWRVTSSAGSWQNGQQLCSAEFAGSTFGVPANGFQNALLTAARPSTGAAVWLDYAQVGGRWTPHASA